MARAQGARAQMALAFETSYGSRLRVAEAALGAPPERLLMVGDSPEHDIAGGHAAGWSTMFVAGGLHHSVFAAGPCPTALNRLCANHGAPHPDFAIQRLQ